MVLGPDFFAFAEYLAACQRYRSDRAAWLARDQRSSRTPAAAGMLRPARRPATDMTGPRGARIAAELSTVVGTPSPRPRSENRVADAPPARPRHREDPQP